MGEPKFTRHKVTILKGAIGDMGQEWMTDKDWEEHDKYVEELKASGEYLKPEEVTVDIIDNPLYDDRKLLNSTLESASFGFLDFGRTQDISGIGSVQEKRFHGEDVDNVEDIPLPVIQNGAGDKETNDSTVLVNEKGNVWVHASQAEQVFNDWDQLYKNMEYHMIYGKPA